MSESSEQVSPRSPGRVLGERLNAVFGRAPDDLPLREFFPGDEVKPKAIYDTLNKADRSLITKSFRHIRFSGIAPETVRGLRKMSVKELKRVPGLGDSSAEFLYFAFLKIQEDAL